MKFFLPGDLDENRVREIYAHIREALSYHNLSPRRIFKLEYRYNETIYRAEVGKFEGRTGAFVIAILYDEIQDLYCIWSPSCVDRGMAPFISGYMVEKYTDFD